MEVSAESSADKDQIEREEALANVARPSLPSVELADYIGIRGPEAEEILESQSARGGQRWT